VGHGGVDLVKLVAPRPGEVPIRNLVHPIDKAKHPSWAGHFRWSVQVGEDPCDERFMLQAGVAESAAAAARDGDWIALAVVNAFEIVGLSADWRGPTFLDEDPLPPD